MSSAPPELIAIDHDDYHAAYVGRTADDRQFFLTFPFVAATDDHPGDQFLALFLFDGEGRLLEARIDALGSRADLDDEARLELHGQRLRELGTVTFERIVVAPFSVDRFGVQFGLILCPSEDEDDSWWVELHPGNYMAFHEPWDSGEYDT